MQSSTLTAAGSLPMPISYGASIIIFPPNQTVMRGKRSGFGPIRSSNPPPSMSVDYSSSVSVFPAEACETVGGEACLAEMYPETKLKEAAKQQDPNNNNKTSSKEEAVDREYLDYAKDPNTVLLDEACDVLGGEFCQPSS